MSYERLINTTLLGNRLGLQKLTSAIHGITAPAEVLVGAEAVRGRASTADTTATGLAPFGVSLLTTGLSADTTSVFRLDPPVPGVEKTLVWGSTTVGTMGSKIFVTNSTGGGAGFQTSGGSSFTCVASSAGAVMRLMGVTTALWAVINGTTASGFTFTTST